MKIERGNSLESILFQRDMEYNQYELIQSMMIQNVMRRVWKVTNTNLFSLCTENYNTPP